MAIDWNGADGLFPMLGKFVKMVNVLDETEDRDINEQITDIKTMFETVNDTQGQMEPLISQFVADSWVNWRRVVRGLKRQIVDVYVPLVLDHFFVVLEDYTRRDVQSLIDFMFDRMILDSVTINNNVMTLGAATYGREYDTKNADPATSSNFGDWDVVFGLCGDNGYTAAGPTLLGWWPHGTYRNEWVLSQDLRIICTSGENEGAGDGNEQFIVEGQEPADDGVFAGQEDLGAGAINLWDNLGDYGGVSILSEHNTLTLNAALEDWTSTVLDDWDIDTGAWATQAIKETTNFYRGAAAIKWPSGQTQWVISQPVADLVIPESTYICSFRMKCATSIVGAFSVSLQLYSATNPTRYDVTFEGATYGFNDGTDPTDWTLVWGYVNTREVIDDDLVIRFVASDDGGGCIPSQHTYYDDFFFQRVEKLNGLSITPVVGQSPGYAGDMATASITNAYDGIFQTFFGRFYQRSLPHSQASGTGSISDSLAEGSPHS